MPGALVTVVAGVLLLYSLAARRATDANISAAMAAVTTGMVAYALGEQLDLELPTLHLLAEVTLVLVLFHDASTVQLAQLRHDYSIALRLLAIGFPLALIVTAAASWLLFPALGLAGVILLAAAITPTDAGLGAATVLNPAVPIRVRRALNVESGLNDGLATPIVLISLSALASAEHTQPPSLLKVGVVPLLLAVVLPAVLGPLVAKLVDWSRAGRWSTAQGREIAVFLLPLLMLGVSELTGANAFIAAFVGGLVFGSVCRTTAQEPSSSHLLETIADLLGLVVWFVGGTLVVDILTTGFRWQWLVMAVAALTVLRIVPVWLGMLGAGYRWQTIGFLGWFGPRGLASIIFALLAIDELGTADPVIPDVVGVIAVTVLISVFAHGLSAGPLSQAYGQWVRRVHPPIEREPSVEPRSARGQVVAGQVDREPVPPTSV